MADVHPNAAILDGLKVFIESIVDQRLRQTGATKAELGPRELRIAAGLDLMTAADRAGISHSTLSRLEAGKIRRPTPATMDRVAAALGCSAAQYRGAVATLLNRGAA